MAHGAIILPPLVVSELVSGAGKKSDRVAVETLLANLPLHETPLDYWIRVGQLRRLLKERGFSVSTPDAHIAQCALDRQALLLSRDAVFSRIARHTGLRMHSGQFKW